MTFTVLKNTQSWATTTRHLNGRPIAIVVYVQHKRTQLKVSRTQLQLQLPLPPLSLIPSWPAIAMLLLTDEDVCENHDDPAKTTNKQNRGNRSSSVSHA